MSIERFTLRPGVRLSYDDITKDVNVAPRLFANVDILNDHRFNLNAGYNRYYGSQILTYALSARQQKNAYNRSLNSDGTPTEWTYDAKRSQSSEYKNLGDLKTPYSDEYTLGASLRFKLSKGNIEIKLESQKQILKSRIFLFQDTIPMLML